MTTATFSVTPNGGAVTPARLGAGFLWELLRDGRTPIRALSDVAIARQLPCLLGDGAIYELGSPSDYYKKFVPESQEYVLTDMAGGEGVVEVDMTAMPFKDESVDAFFSAFALEHVENYLGAISEMKRTLKPGGRVLLVVPFLYYFHAAPSDYVRFTTEYVRKLMGGLEVLRLESIGTRWTFVAEWLHEKPFSRPYSSPPVRLLKRLAACALMTPYVLRPKLDDAYCSGVLVLAQKPGGDS
ncbi:MAG: class I SAM-dependent methyltransferase [Planctomycetota bacterium]